MTPHIKVDFLLPTDQVFTSNISLNRHVKRKKIKALRELAEKQARGLVGPEPCRVIAYLGFHLNRRRDPNNWHPTTKALLDGLVDAGVFSDDNYAIIQGPDHRILDYKPPKGHIYILFETTEMELPHEPP